MLTPASWTPSARVLDMPNATSETARILESMIEYLLQRQMSVGITRREPPVEDIQNERRRSTEGTGRDQHFMETESVLT